MPVNNWLRRSRKVTAPVLPLNFMVFRQRLFWLFILSLFCWGSATIWQAMSERQSQRYARLADEVQEFVLDGIRKQNNVLDSLSTFLKDPYLNLRQLNSNLGKFSSPG